MPCVLGAASEIHIVDQTNRSYGPTESYLDLVYLQRVDIRHASLAPRQQGVLNEDWRRRSRRLVEVLETGEL